MKRLNILWTTDNKDTFINMIAMYSSNSLIRGWWEEVNVIIWGASAKLAAKDHDVQEEIKNMLDSGVKIEGCMACSEKFGVTKKLEELGISMKYMGEPFTQYLQNNEKVITI